LLRSRSDEHALAPRQPSAHGTTLLRRQLIEQHASDGDIVQLAERVLQRGESREKRRDRPRRKAAGKEVAAIAQALYGDAHGMATLDIVPVDAPRPPQQPGVRALQ